MGSIPENTLKLAVLQRVCTGYRTALFKRLSVEPGLDALLCIGADVPETKVKNAPYLDGVNLRRLPTRFMRLGHRILPWHVGLVDRLREFEPDVILCEGESHFIGYLQAIYYKLFYSRRVALMHWCFISLPGWPTIGGSGHRSLIKRIFRNFFDAFVVYSSFSKESLLSLGQPAEKIFVATNVGDVEKYIAISDGLRETKDEARKKINLPERFTVLFLGTLDANKRPDVILELARRTAGDSINFVLLGSGELLELLRARVAREGLNNVFLPGRVTENLPLFFRASDVLVIPGRGGIVISEAMAFGLPVIVHQADGTEYDLVKNGETGLLLPDGGVDAFLRAISLLHGNPSLCTEMSARSQYLVRSRFSTDNMVKQIVRAARYAKNTVVGGDRGDVDAN